MRLVKGQVSAILGDGLARRLGAVDSGLRPAFVGATGVWIPAFAGMTIGGRACAGGRDGVDSGPAPALAGVAGVWIPASVGRTVGGAGITIRVEACAGGTDGVVSGPAPAFVGVTGGWIPAFAGKTIGGAGMTIGARQIAWIGALPIAESGIVGSALYYCLIT